MLFGTNPMADGLSFIIPNTHPTAVGGAGGGLAYAGIGKSVAVKFDIWNNAGEGFNSTGLFFDGDAPDVPHQPGEATVDLSSTPIDLRSQHIFRATLNYDGTTLS